MPAVGWLSAGVAEPLTENYFRILPNGVILGPGVSHPNQSLLMELHDAPQLRSFAAAVHGLPKGFQWDVLSRQPQPWGPLLCQIPAALVSFPMMFWQRHLEKKSNIIKSF